MAELVAKAVAAFESDLGWRVEPVKTPWGPKGPELARFFWPAHFSRHADRLPEFRDRMDPGFVACIEAGLHITMADYQKTRLVKYAYCAEIHHFFEDWDFLLDARGVRRGVSGGAAATAALAAASVGLAELGGVLLPLQPVAKSGGVVPCGFTKDGLPVGLQIVGRRFDDLGVLQMSAAFEAARPGRPGARRSN